MIPLHFFHGELAVGAVLGVLGVLWRDPVVVSTSTPPAAIEGPTTLPLASVGLRRSGRGAREPGSEEMLMR
jgi:hypothetical protein